MLKPTHAVTMHAILVLPMLAWILSFAPWSERRRVGAVLAAAGGYIAFAGVVVATNVAGIELREASSATIALSAAGVGLLLGIGGVAVFSSRRAG